MDSVKTEISKTAANSRGGRRAVSRPTSAELAELCKTNTISQLANKLGVGTTTISRWIADAKQEGYAEQINAIARPGRKAFSRPSSAELVEMYKTHNLSELASELGAGIGTVSKWLDQARQEGYADGIDAVKHPIRISSRPELSELLEMYRTSDVNEMAEALGVKPVTIYKWLGEAKQEGYADELADIRSRNYGRMERPVSAEALVRMRRKNTINELAEIFDVSDVTVQKWLNEAGQEGYADELAEISNNAKRGRKPIEKTVTTSVLVKLYKANTIDEMAELFGVSTYIISNWLDEARKEGYAEEIDKIERFRRNQSSRPDAAKLVEMYKKNTLKEMAAELGVSTSVINLWLKAAKREGYAEELKAIRSEHYKKSDRKSKCPELSKLVEMYRTNTMREMAKSLGVAPSTIRAWLDEAKQKGYAEELAEIRSRKQSKVECTVSAEELVEMYKKNTLQEMAKSLGVSVDTIKSWLNKARKAGYADELAEIRSRKYGKIDCPVSAEELIEMYKTKTMSEMAAELGVSIPVIDLWLKAAKKEGYAEELKAIRSEHYRKNGRKSKCPELSRLVEMYRTNTIDEMAKSLGVAPSTIRTWLDEAKQKGYAEELAEIRSRKQSVKNECPVSAEELVEMYKTNTMSEMAETLGVSDYTLRNWLDEVKHGEYAEEVAEIRSRKCGKIDCPVSAEELVEMYKTKTMSEMAEMLGVSDMTIKRWLNKAKQEGYADELAEIRSRKYGKTDCPVSAEELVDMYKTNTLSEMAKSLGTTPATIHAWLSEAKQKGYAEELADIRSRKYGKIECPVSAEELVEMYKTNTISEMAKSFGVSGFTLSKWLNEAEQKGYAEELTEIRSGRQGKVECPVSAEELVEMYKTNTLKEMAKSLGVGVSTKTIKNWIRQAKENGYAGELTAIRGNRPSVEELVKMHQEMTLPELARACAVSTRTIKIWLNEARKEGYAEVLDKIASERHGHGKRNAGGSAGNPNRPSDNDLVEMYRRYTPLEIGSIVNADEKTVYKWLQQAKKNGFEDEINEIIALRRKHKWPRREPVVTEVSPSLTVSRTDEILDCAQKMAVGPYLSEDDCRKIEQELGENRSPEDIGKAISRQLWNGGEHTESFKVTQDVVKAYENDRNLDRVPGYVRDVQLEKYVGGVDLYQRIPSGTVDRTEYLGFYDGELVIDRTDAVEVETFDRVESLENLLNDMRTATAEYLYYRACELVTTDFVMSSEQFLTDDDFAELGASGAFPQEIEALFDRECIDASETPFVHEFRETGRLSPEMKEYLDCFSDSECLENLLEWHKQERSAEIGHNCVQKQKANSR